MKYIKVLVGRVGSAEGEFTPADIDQQRGFFREINALPIQRVWAGEIAPCGAIEACLSTHDWTADDIERRWKAGRFHPTVVLDLRVSEEPPAMPTIEQRKEGRVLTLEWGYSSAMLREMLRLLKADCADAKFVNYQLPTMSNKPQVWISFDNSLDARQFDCRHSAKLYPPIVKSVARWDGTRPQFAATEAESLRIGWKKNMSGQWLAMIDAAENWNVAIATESAMIVCDDAACPRATPSLRQEHA